MSCNGCRVLRKGCSDSCVLRSCLQWIERPDAQAHATIFLAKFFGRAGLISFVSAVPESQRPNLFQSLLYEACGRTINPVNGAVGLLWSGNWHLCVAAVEMVLRGKTLGPMIFPVELSGDDDVDAISVEKRPRGVPDGDYCDLDLDLSLKPTSAVLTAVEKRQPGTLSEDWATTRA